MTANIPVSRVGALIPIAHHYPDEPHPDNEHAWKAWWVKKCFKLNQPLTRGAVIWIHQCWIQTKATWGVKPCPTCSGDRKIMAATGDPKRPIKATDCPSCAL